MDDYRNSFDDTTLPLGSLAPGGSNTGTIEVGGGDSDVFAITLVQGRTYRFDLTGQAGGTVNTNLTLRGLDGGYLTADWGYAISDPASILYTATASGTYYLVAAGGGSTESGAYSLSSTLGFNDDYRDSYDNTLEPLGQVATGGSKAGTLEVGGDSDVFAISLVEGRTYTFAMTGQAGGAVNTNLTLRGLDGGYLTADWGYAISDPASILYTATASGTYYLVAAAGASTDTGAYSVSSSSGFEDDYRDTYDDTLEPLGQVVPGGSSTGTIEVGGDSDVFAISLVAGRTYNFELIGQAGGTVNTSLTLRGLDGGYLNADWGNASDDAAHILYTATASGIHYLVAAGGTATDTGAYTLSSDGGLIDDYRDVFNDASEPLGTIAPGGAKTGVIETAGDKDIFRINLTAGQTYAFTLQELLGSNLDDVSLTLRGGGGGFIASDIGIGEAAQFNYTATKTGAFYLEAAGAASTDLGGYRVSVSAGTISDDYRNSYNAAGLPLGALPVNGSKTGVIETAGDKDIFAVTLAAGKVYTFDLAGIAGNGAALANPELRLLNRAGATLLTNNDFNGPSSHLVYKAAANGTYYLDAHSFSGAGTGNYRISAKVGFDDYRDSRTDTTSVLGQVGINGSTLGVIETAGDRDYFAVNLTAGRSYTFDLAGIAQGSSALADAELRLINGAGKVLLTNDDFNGADSRLVYKAGATATYYLDVHSFTAAGTGAYQIGARLNFDDLRDTRTDTTSALGSLAVNGSRLGVIETGGDKDIFAITLTAGKSYTFDLSGIASGSTALANPELRLLNSAGAVIQINNDFNSLSSRIVYTATVSGTFYLDVHSFTAAGTGAYTIGAKLGFDDFRDTKQDTTAARGVLALDQSKLGTIETPGDSDLFDFTLVKGKTYQIDLTCGAGAGQLRDGDIQLLSPGGAMLAYSDDVNGTTDAQIVFTAEVSGIHYLNVRGVGVATGVYAVELIDI